MALDQGLGQERKRVVDRRLIIAWGAVGAGYGRGTLGLAFLPLLARDQPRLLILLNPTTAVLLLVSARIDLASFLTLAILRRVAFHILFFLLGTWYGRVAVRWVETRSGRATRLVAYIERAFARMHWPVLLLWPGPFPAVLAGAAGMGRWRFLALALTGTVLAVLFVRFAAGVAADPLGPALLFSDRHTGPLTIICLIAATWPLLRWW